jgi:hypothetical protein
LLNKTAKIEKDVHIHKQVQNTRMQEPAGQHAMPLATLQDCADVKDIIVHKRASIESVDARQNVGRHKRKRDWDS